MRIACSSNCVTALGVTFLLAIKYPLKQEEIPIKIKENGNILSAGMARLSSNSVVAMNSAPKNTVRYIYPRTSRYQAISN